MKNLIKRFFLKFPNLYALISKILFTIFYRLPILNRGLFLWKFNFLQKVQYGIENAYFLNGNPRVTDPFFHCEVIYENKRKRLVKLKFYYKGVKIKGYIHKSRKNKSVLIYLNDTCIAKTKIRKNHTFKFRIKRNVINSFPNTSIISFMDEFGDIISDFSRQKISLNIPYGNGEIFREIQDNGLLTKKGAIPISKEQMSDLHNSYLKIYGEVNTFFEKHFGKPLIIMYGTLLGFYRDGDFISGDDDFDCCYLSDEKDPTKVKEESIQMVLKLINAGYTISFNRSGKLFRIYLMDIDVKTYYLDICPIWFTEDKTYSNPAMSVFNSKEDFYPYKSGTFKGQRVKYPNDPEVFFNEYYGKGWKYPDPGYVTDKTKLNKNDLKILRRSLISPKEYQQIQNTIAEYDEPKGKFISLSLQNLYPLDEFII